MADNEQKNSANLGELFVEFGSKGLGGLIKGLNSVSATFLLTKNAGQQMLQPLANISKQAGQSVVALDKLNSVTGISVGQLQALKQWSTLNNIDFNDYIGQVHSLQNALARMSLGDASSIKGFAMLGLNPADFNPYKPLENMKKVENAMRRMYKQGGEGAKYQIALALQLLGLNEELAYSYTRANKQIDKSLLLTDKQQEKLREQQEAWNGLKVASESFFNKLMANAGIFEKFINGATNAFKDLVAFIDANREKKITIIADIVITGAKNLLHFIKWFSLVNEEGEFKPDKNHNFLMSNSIRALNFSNDVSNELLRRVGITPISDRLKEAQDKRLVPTSFQKPNAISNNISKNTTTNVNYNIAINQEITGNDMNEIAYNVSNSTEKSLIQVITGSNMV